LNKITFDFDTQNPEKGTSFLELPRGTYEEVEKPKTFLFKASAITDTKIVKLNIDCYENINKKSIVNGQKIFNVLQRFRQQKLLGQAVKEEAFSEFYI
jgi:hypothetical protein